MEIEGEWPANDIRRAFVAGAKWWEYHSTGATMWQSDQRLAEDEATRRYASNTPLNGDHGHGAVKSMGEFLREALPKE